MKAKKNCNVCGVEYWGVPNSFYCPDCSGKRNTANHKKKLWSGEKGRSNSRTDKAYCPKCEKWHPTSTHYTGNGTLREYCDLCRRQVDDLYPMKIHTVYA